MGTQQRVGCPFTFIDIWDTDSAGTPPSWRRMDKTAARIKQIVQAIQSLSQPLRRQRKKTRRLHEQDLAAEHGVVHLCSVELDAAVEDEVYHTDANAQQ